MNIFKKVDFIDKEIISMLQGDPAVTHSQIALKLNRSQPAIGARIKKLRDFGLIATQIGIDFKKVENIAFVRIDLIAKYPNEIQSLCDKCPYIINSFKLSGEYNLFILMAGDTYSRLDAIIDAGFRDNPNISKTKVELITHVSKKLILPFNKVLYEADESIENYSLKNEILLSKSKDKFMISADVDKIASIDNEKYLY